MLNEWKNIKWTRSSDMFEGEDYKVFFESIEPNDIIQGNLGNCYYLSALSALAEFPDRIKKLFITTDINKPGCYAARLCLNGEFRTIVIDDLFPCSGDNPNCSAFSKCRGNELWVLILEKVWAKINHTYENTITGYVSEAFRCLTGAPVEFYDHEYFEDIWNIISEADKRNYIICASAGK